MAELLVNPDEFVNNICDQGIQNNSEKSLHHNFKVEDLSALVNFFLINVIRESNMKGKITERIKRRKYGFFAFR